MSICASVPPSALLPKSGGRLKPPLRACGPAGVPHDLDAFAAADDRIECDCHSDRALFARYTVGEQCARHRGRRPVGNEGSEARFSWIALNLTFKMNIIGLKCEEFWIEFIGHHTSQSLIKCDRVL